MSRGSLRHCKESNKNHKTYQREQVVPLYGLVLLASEQLIRRVKSSNL